MQTIDVGNGLAAVAYGEGSVWVTNTDDHTITRIDPDKRQVATRRRRSRPTEIAVGAGTVWVTSGTEPGGPSRSGDGRG